MGGSGGERLSPPALTFDILSILPTLFESPFSVSILKRAQETGLVSLKIHDIRNFASDKHRTVDDIPYGGGPGMVMKPEPVVAAIEAVVHPDRKVRRIYFSPQGRPLKQEHLHEYLGYDQIVLLCGRYEGLDERVMPFVDEEVSIGDYVLSGGEFAALVFVDAVARLVPGVVGCAESLQEESFSDSSLLEYPQYTRPPDFRGSKVPEVLLSGDHKKIAEWRRQQATLRTKKKRPDLLKK